MKHSLQLGFKHQLRLTPHLQQAIRLLQLSSPELENEINTALSENFFLQYEKGKSWNTSKKEDLLLQKANEITLKSYLNWQLDITHCTEKERAIAIMLIDALSEDGYLTCSLKEIQDSLERQDINVSEIERVLTHIQQFEPVGVGARNLSESLSIQLKSFPPDTPFLQEAKYVALHHLKALSKRDYKGLRSRLKLTPQSLERVIKILLSLNPKPGAQISSKRGEYIIPDFIIKKKNQNFIVQLNKEFIPKVRLNPLYRVSLQHAKTKGEIQMLQMHLKEAKWFINSLQTRNELLLKVVNCIFEAQKDFLELGEEGIKPLLLQDIAKKVGLHESTISRITKHKYILTPKGVFELKFFFSNLINTTSTKSIRALIKRMITEENPLKPWSDQHIMQELYERGIRMTRRTVTKYREVMHIPTSHKRKCLNPQSKIGVCYANPNNWT